MSQLPPREFFEAHAELCKMFSNANRLMILDLLREGERTVSEITDRTGIPQPTISQHLTWLREEGVVSRRKDGVQSYYSITDERIYSAIDVMRELTKEEMAQS